jgi:hypothetical protein
LFVGTGKAIHITTAKPASFGGSDFADYICPPPVYALGPPKLGIELADHPNSWKLWPTQSTEAIGPSHIQE